MTMPWNSTGKLFKHPELLSNQLSWMLNLGVVPLFLLAFFLTEPLFFNLLALRFFVTRVRETIISPSSMKTLVCSKGDLVAILPFLVKMIIIFCLTSPFVFIFSSGGTYAQSLSDPLSVTILRRGQIFQLSLSRQERVFFSKTAAPLISPLRILRVTPKSKTSLIHSIQAKKIGGEILQIFPSGRKELYLVPELIHHQLLPNLIEERLKSDDKDPTQLIFFGKTLQDYHQFHLLKNLLKHSPLSLQFHFQQEDLKTIEDDLTKIFSFSLDSPFKCHILLDQLSCFISPEVHSLTSLINRLQKKTFIHFYPLKKSLLQKNYVIKMKLLQIEKYRGEEFDFLPSSLRLSYQDLLHQGLEQLTLKHELVIQDLQLHLSTLAKQESLIIPSTELIMSLGAEYPFQTKQRTSSTTHDYEEKTSWKFAGFKLHLFLQPHLFHEQKSFSLRYNIHLSSHQQGLFQGTKEEGTIVLTLNQPLKLFDLGLKIQSQESQSFPVISQIPLLGNLFRSQSDKDSFKKILCLIELVENDVKDFPLVTPESKN
jgi:hypothetical protein